MTTYNVYIRDKTFTITINGMGLLNFSFDRIGVGGLGMIVVQGGNLQLEINEEKITIQNIHGDRRVLLRSKIPKKFYDALWVVLGSHYNSVHASEDEDLEIYGPVKTSTFRWINLMGCTPFFSFEFHVEVKK